MFFAEPMTSSADTYTDIFLYVISALFGCVHLVPSFFIQYPSNKEMWLWRISAVIITAVPVISMAFRFLYDSVPNWITILLAVPLSFLMLLYIAARLVLIILSFLSLHHLPENAYHTIDWISSIPHL